MDVDVYITSVYFDPREAMPTLDVGISCKPRCWVSINRQWIPHIVGVLDRLTYLDAWEGTDDEKREAIHQVECLIAQLGGR